MFVGCVSKGLTVEGEVLTSGMFVACISKGSILEGEALTSGMCPDKMETIVTALASDTELVS